MPMHHGHVLVHVCTISILWNFHTNPYQSSETTSGTTGDGAVDTSRTTNYELQGTGRATRAPVAQTLQSVRQTCLRTIYRCSYLFARFPSCGIFKPTRTSPVNKVVTTGNIRPASWFHIINFWKGASRKDHGLVRALRTNTAKRAPNMPMHHRHVLVRVCVISILWNFQTNPYQSREQSCNNW